MTPWDLPLASGRPNRTTRWVTERSLPLIEVLLICSLPAEALEARMAAAVSAGSIDPAVSTRLLLWPETRSATSGRETQAHSDTVLVDSNPGFPRRRIFTSRESASSLSTNGSWIRSADTPVGVL